MLGYVLKKQAIDTKVYKISRDNLAQKKKQNGYKILVLDNIILQLSISRMLSSQHCTDLTRAKHYTENIANSYTIQGH